MTTSDVLALLEAERDERGMRSWAEKVRLATALKGSGSGAPR